MKLKRKHIIWLVIIVVVVSAIIFNATKPTYLNVTAASPKKGDIEEIISTTGTIESESLVAISSDVSGELTEIYVKIGDTVTVGTLLAQVKPDNYRTATERASAALDAQKMDEVQGKNQIEQAKLKVQKAEQDLNRIRTLVSKEVGNPADLLAAQTTFDLAVKDLNNLKNALRIAEFNSRSASATLKDAMQTLSKTQIKSPINGIVLDVYIKKGEKVVGTGQMSGTVIMGLADVNQLEVKTLINENDINRVHKGQPAKIHIDAVHGLSLGGLVYTVSTINKDKATSDAVTEYESRIKLDPKNKSNDIKDLRLGMTATVDVVRNSKKNRLLVPIQTVLFKTDSTHPNPDGSFNDYEYVLKAKNGKALITKVKTGISNSSLIEILSGLTLKDTILTGPYDVLIGPKVLKEKLKIEKYAK